LKLQHDRLLSNVAIKCKLRHYSMEAARAARKQAEDADKLMHATYRAQAAPKMAGSRKNRPNTAAM